MQEKLEIDTVQLPEEGKEFSGVLDPKIFGLPENDTQPVGGLEYDLFVQCFDDELLLQGFLAAPFQFTCVRTNNLFVQTISLEDVAISITVTSSVIDVTEALREEVLINFPNYPRCDQADEPMECKIDNHYLVLDKPAVDSVSDAPPHEGDDQWSALDGFNQFKDNQ